MSYTIQQVAKLTGLPTSTLRYYESVGIIEPIARDNSSKHRKYSKEDLEMIESIACLNAVQIPIKEIKHYLENIQAGVDAVDKQIELFAAHEQRLDEELEAIKLRKQYVSLKLKFWKAVAASDKAEADRLLSQARELSVKLVNLNS